jgi:uncharacterized protein
MIDCDVHNDITELADLVPYMQEGYRSYILGGGFDGFQMETYPWVNPTGFFRRDAEPEGGQAPGSSYELLKEQLLDAYDVEYAMLTGGMSLGASCLPHAQVAAEISSAHNRLVVDEWLARDDRLRGSIAVATQDAAAAAKEIRRASQHPGFSQVMLPGGAQVAYGDPRYWPIYEAAMEAGLPVGVHIANDGLGINPPPTAAGYPSYYFEYRTLINTPTMAHITSLIAHGVCERYRELKFVFIESGSAWVPTLAWKLDESWQYLREEVPWAKRRPSDVIREHMRFTTQPLEQPASGRDLHQILDMFEGFDEMLLFASDYPHWDFDAPTQAIRRLRPEWRERVSSENARALYRLPVRATASQVGA